MEFLFILLSISYNLPNSYYLPVITKSRLKSQYACRDNIAHARGKENKSEKIKYDLCVFFQKLAIAFDAEVSSLLIVNKHTLSLRKS